MRTTSLKTMELLHQESFSLKRAIGSFNAFNYDSASAVVDAADNAGVPVIVQFSARTVKWYGADCIYSWVDGLARRARVPVTLHLDHCKDLDIIKSCLAAGWPSVMFDASEEPFDDNVRQTRAIVEMAGATAVEAELGQLIGVEDGYGHQHEVLTDPESARRFIEATGVGSLAVAIGNAHGHYANQTPFIDFPRLERIHTLTNHPLVLHGGSGLSRETLKRAAELGIVKINFSTDLKDAAWNATLKYSEAGTGENPLTFTRELYEAIKRVTADKLALLQ